MSNSSHYDFDDELEEIILVRRPRAESLIEESLLRAREITRDKPLLSLVAAAVAGALIGIVVGR